jgi:hypothetical protein
MGASVKEIESLKNIAPFVCVPLFAIVCVKSGFLAEMSPENEAISLIIRFSIFSVLSLMAYVLITPYIFRYATYGNHSSIELMPLPAVIGFSGITLGLYGVGALIPALGLPQSPLDIFWHLGFLTYGFILLSTPY